MVHARHFDALDFVATLGPGAGTWEFLVRPVRQGPAPGIALDALIDIARLVLVVHGDQVSFDHFQRVRHARTMIQAGNRTDQALGEYLAIAQPGLGQHALHLGPVMPMRHFRDQAPVAIGVAQLLGVIVMDSAVTASWLRLDADAGRADDVIDQGAQRAAGDIVVLFQVARQGTQGYRALLDLGIG